MKKNELVILLHGLGLSSFTMLYIERGLIAAGYVTLKIDYPSRKYNVPRLLEITNGLVQKNITISDYEKVHYVGHSLGGILARLLALKHTDSILGCCVALGSPNIGSILAAKMCKYRLINAFFGPALSDISPGSKFINTLTVLPKCCFVLRGTRSSFTPFGNCLGKPNDGTVIVDEMVPEGMASAYVYDFYVSHSSMLFNVDVRDNVIDILENN